MWPRLIGTVCLICLLATGLAFAQTTGNIRGTVTDGTGAVLPGAAVTITSPALIGGSRASDTNELGVYRFPSLPVGTYSVIASMDGFETVQVDNVAVTLNATATINFTLKLATVAETVTVVGESPVVDVTSSKSSTSFRDQMVEELPTYRNFYDYVKIAPGMSATTEGASGGDRTVAFGSNQQSNSWMIDGIETKAPETGSSWWSINPDTIEEVTILGVGAPAEFGNAMGAVFNVVTKKGGDTFHGGANGFFQAPALTGTNVLKDDFGFERDVYRDVTAQLGGPIVRNRIWFYGAFEHYRDSSIQPGNDPALVGADLGRSDRYDFKVTAKLGEKHEIGGLLHYDDWAFIGGGSPFVAPSAASVERGHNPAWGANLTSVLSEQTLLELKYAGWWSDDIRDSPTGTLEEPFIDYTPPGGGPATYSGGVIYPWDYKTWSQQFSGKVTHYTEQFLRSQHEFKFGVQFARGSAKTNVGIGPNGTYSYSYYGYLYRAYMDPYQYGGVSTDLGVFVDDAITIGKHLTLNLGVRFDRNTGGIPDYERLTTGTPSIAVALNALPTGEIVPGVPDLIDWNTMSPRIGFAIQPDKEGRSVIKGFFGVFYDSNVIGNWDAPAPGLPTFRIYAQNPETGGFLDGDVTYELTAQDVAFHPDLSPPRTLQYTIGFEQQFGADLSAGVQYVRKSTKDLVGWEILDGVYEPFQFTDPFTGREFTLLNQIEQPTLRKGNDPGNFPGSENLDFEQEYDGVVFSFNKRFSHNWGLMTSYTWSRSEGLIPRMLTQTQFNPFYGGKDGSDPNNLLFNAHQRLQGDRPHMFRLQGVFRLPWDFMVSTSINLESGRPFNRQIRIFGLGQGQSIAIMEPAGAKSSTFPEYPELRRSADKNVDLMIGKRFTFGKNVKLKLDATIYNLLNSDNELYFANLRVAAGDTFVPDSWVLPRRLMLRVGFEF